MYAQSSTTDTHGIFRISKPLVSSELLDVFSNVPIPIWVKGQRTKDKGQRTLYNIKTTIIAVNAHRDRFIDFKDFKFFKILRFQIQKM